MDTTQQAALEAQLDELQRESEARREELKALAAAMPEATSRRLLVKQMVSELVHAPDRTSVAKRAILKVLRTPTDLVRRVRSH
ncbi:MAG TPA: hypothetical protein VMM60_12110 [Ilumatobacter sp.]|nr:hypothetical protein [Ilumatobacter sp.]